MNPALTNQVLNQVLAIHTSSLATYLSYAAPWKRRGADKAEQTLASIVVDQQQLAERLGKLILENGGEVASADFPLSYTSLHFLSLEYLVAKLVEHQRQDIAGLEQCAEQLSSSSLAQALALNAVQTAKKHLQCLEELERERLESASQ